MWEKIVLNLVSNAFKFTFEGEITVSLLLSRNGEKIELTVRDTGTGIPPDELPRLFCAVEAPLHALDNNALAVRRISGD
jgi:K+-sensing histidine kinase KdpD